MSKNEHGDFVCEPCDYRTSRISNYQRHNCTPKHKMVTNGNTNEQDNLLTCPDCGKSYRHRSGLSRHRKSCERAQSSSDGILESIVRDQGVIKSKLEDLAKAPKSVTIAPKKMTLNVFLDVACKDAMNFADFVNCISVTMSDLDYSRENGYIEGMGNILSRSLQQLSPLSRPIHCSDKRRMVFYVKDDDAWQRDGGDKITGSLDLITQKQVQQIKEWERNHEGWEADERKVGEWMAVVRNVMGNAEPVQREADKVQVLKTLTTTTELREAMESINQNEE